MARPHLEETIRSSQAADRHRHYDANHHALRLSPRLALARRVLSVLLHLLLFHKPGIRGANRCHVKYHSIADHLPRVLRMALDILIQVSMLIVFIIFFGGSIDCVKATIISGQRSPALQIPMTIPYLATSIGFFLAIIRSVQSSFQSIKLLLTGGDIKVDAMTAVEEELDEASQQLFRNQKGGN